MKNKSFIWILAILAILAAAWYFFIRKKPAAAPAGNNTQPATGGGTTVIIQPATGGGTTTTDTGTTRRVITYAATLGKKVQQPDPVDRARGVGFQIRPGNGSMSTDSLGNFSAIRSVLFGR